MGVPALADVRDWKPDYLTAAAQHWDQAAHAWTAAYDRVFREVQSPGGTKWTGDGADAAARRVSADGLKVTAAVDHLNATAAAARTAAIRLAAAQAKVLDAVAAAEATGFAVEEDYSVRDLGWNLSLPGTAMRRAQAAVHAARIRAAVLALVALDDEAARAISAGANELRALSFGSGDPPESPVQLAGFQDSPFPEKPSTEGPPGEPPGGWSNDPITRAAQRIAYGHAGIDHLHEWPAGTTRDQVASEVERIMRAGTDPNGGMIVGRTKDGAPAIYDPKTNTLVIRDLNAADAGTAYKPTGGEQYVVERKAPIRVPSIPPGELADAPLRPPPEPPKIEPPRPAPAPRGGFPPIAGMPQIVPTPHGGSAEVPIIDADGIPDAGTPGAG